MVQTANTVFRDFETDGVMASGRHKPKKSEIRPLLTRLENIYDGALAGGALVYETKADLTADTTQVDNAMAWVLGDDTAANNGIYQFDGTDTWTRLGDLPYSYIKASNAGAGTANAIVATTSIPIPAADGGALIALPIVADNTAKPVTVSFNGGAALTVKTSSGNDVSVGGLKAGMIVDGYVSGSTFRLRTDQAGSAVVADAEAAADRAEAAAASIDYLTVVDRTALKAVDTATHTVVFVRDVGMNAKWDATVPVATHQADTAENIYVAPDPAAVGAWVFQDGKAVSLAFPAYNRPLWAKLGDFFTAKDAGLKGDGVDDTSAMSDLLTYCGANQATVFFPDGIYRATQSLSVTVAASKALVWKGTNNDNSIIALDTDADDDDGITIALPGNYWLDADPGRSGLQLSDLCFTTTNANVGRGLVIEGQGLGGRPMASMRLDRIMMRAKSAPNTQGWATFIEAHNVGGIWMEGPRLILGGPSNTTSNGIHVYNDLGMDGGSVSLIHPQILYGNAAILAGQHAEGFYVTQPEIVGSLYGFKTDLTAGESGYHIFGGHMNVKQAGILLDYGYDFVIMGVLIWRNDTTTADWNGIQLANGGRGVVAANNIKGKATGGDETGVNVVSSDASGRTGISIVGNTFIDCSGRGIWAAAAADYVDVGPNTYRNVGARVLNQSASGSVSITPKVYSASKVFVLTGGASTENLDIPLPIGMFTSAPGNVEVNDGAGFLRGAYDFANSTATTARVIIRNFAGGSITGTSYRLGVVATENAI